MNRIARYMATVFSNIDYPDPEDNENIEVSNISAMGAILYGLTPVPLAVYNINDGDGDWGRFITVEFDHEVIDIADQAGCFVLVNENSVEYAALAISYVQGTTKKILLEFLDFNEARETDCELTYTAGDIQGQAVPLEAFEFEFTPTNLVERFPAESTSASNSSDTDITVEFDGSLSCAYYSILKAALSVTGQEYDYVPGGTLQDKTYTIDSVVIDSVNDKKLNITLAGVGRLRAPRGDITVAYNASIGSLMSVTGGVKSFSEDFTPVVSTHVDNPHVIEQIEITNITAVGTLTHVNDL